MAPHYASPINDQANPMNGPAFRPSPFVSQKPSQQQPLQHHAEVSCFERGQQQQLPFGSNMHSDIFEDEFGEFESAEPAADSAAGSAPPTVIEPVNGSGLDPFADIAPRLSNVSLSPLRLPDCSVSSTVSSEVLEETFGEFESAELEKDTKGLSADLRGVEDSIQSQTISAVPLRNGEAQDVGVGARRKLGDRILPRLAINISLDSMISKNFIDAFSNKHVAQPQSQTGEVQSGIEEYFCRESANEHSETHDDVASSSGDDWQTEWHEANDLDSIDSESANYSKDKKRNSTNISNSPISGSALSVDHFASLELSSLASGGIESPMPYAIEAFDSASLTAQQLPNLSPASGDRSTGDISLQDANLLLEQFGTAADVRIDYVVIIAMSSCTLMLVFSEKPSRIRFFQTAP